jgi:hypothetical protein
MNDNIILDMNFTFDKNGFDIIYNKELSSTGALMVLLDFYRMTKTNWSEYKFKTPEDFITVLSQEKDMIYKIIHEEYENKPSKSIHIQVIHEVGKEKNHQYEAEDGFGVTEVFAMSLFFIEILEHEYGDMGLQSLIEVLNYMDKDFK